MAATEDRVEAYLGVGTPAVLQTDPDEKAGPRFSTSILGWKKGRAVSVEHPKTLDGREGVVREGQPCVVRFLHEGNACAFSSVVLDRIGPRVEGQVRLCWPVQVEWHPLRRHERIRFEGSCRITRGEEAFEGQFRDISVGGGGLVVPQGTFLKDDKLELSFRLPDGTEVSGLRVCVRMAGPRAEGCFVGCSFEERQERAQNAICLFVSMELARRRGAVAATEAPRVFIVDSNPASFEAMKKVLARDNIEAYGASNAVDMFYALRAMPFQAVAVSQAMPELPGIELCRLIRAAPGMEKLHVLLYGGGESLASAAMEVRLDRWVPDSESLNFKVAQALVQAVSPDAFARGVQGSAAGPQA